MGPIFARELVTTPRRVQHYIFRAGFVGVLYLVMCTAWLVMFGTQQAATPGDLARFGGLLFQLLMPLQLAVITSLAAQSTASGVAQEKDKRTLLLLLMTSMSNTELVLGKMLSCMLDVLATLLATLPLYAFLTLFGGVDMPQVLRAFMVALGAAMVAGSLGSTVAFAREKTFQALAMTALILVVWVAAIELILFVGALSLSPQTLTIVSGFSPVRALLAAMDPFSDFRVLLSADYIFIAFTVATSVLLNLLAIAQLRIWNPGREVLPQTAMESDESQQKSDDEARQRHVDARVRKVDLKSREVWDNPVLWREMCTWAYGRKVLAIRLGYFLLVAMGAAAVWGLVSSGEAMARSHSASVLPASAQPLAPLFLVSWIIMNAMAVTSITGERDGGALDLLLVTDLSPKEFLLGKLVGVAYVTKEMILSPLLICGYLWWAGGISAENMLYVVLGQLVMSVFVIMLGIHCGLQYASSRSAIGISLGNVIFLFLGVTTLMLLLISFSASYQAQLMPFLAFIVVGGVGLYVTLGARNPSAAIATASTVVPFATFFAVTCFLADQFLQVFLVSATAYGFLTLALLVPAISEFDVALGRGRVGAEE